jgi:hypothetical protein
MRELERIEEAKRQAPSYFKLKDDGADFHCEECGKEGRKDFVATYTPDGKLHRATCLDCIDEDWLKNAKNMGEL